MRWLSRQRNSLGGFVSTQVRGDSIFKISIKNIAVFFIESYDYKFSKLNERFKMVILVIFSFELHIWYVN